MVKMAIRKGMAALATLDSSVGQAIYCYTSQLTYHWNEVLVVLPGLPIPLKDEAMPGNAAKVVVSERQGCLLTEFSKSRSVSQRLADRATIVMLSFEGFTNEEIAQRVGVNRLQVGLWRRDNWES
ncbi:MAG: helix-turn-helix domain-containing protein, partial [Gemmataceae bacterium]|nr:helix-turn-helix domain-containing protein [Gemmataceae bacterium]